MKHFMHLSIFASLMSSFAAATAQQAPLLALPAAPVAAPVRDLFADTWAATDALGRNVALNAQSGAPKPKKTVGIFYFLWQGSKSNPLHDISQIIKANPNAPQWGPSPAFHWWSEPAMGYYLGNDEYVLRKHAQMLNDAGVDVVFFDNTNGPTYPEVYEPMCRVWSQMRAAGNQTPQIAFFPNQGAADRLWKEFYQAGKYKDLWFQWQGKPLFLVKPEVTLSPEATDFFTVRRSWAWSAGAWFGDGKDKWPWLDHSPQKAGWHTEPNQKEGMAVAVAQHPTTSIGRSFQAGKQPIANELYQTPTMGQGLYFREQSEHALKVDPEFVFVTGWNEWLVQRYLADNAGTFAGKAQKIGDSTFVDQFSEEFSRDIEPGNNSLADNYFYQMTDFIRRYKGARAAPGVPSQTVQVDGQFADWDKVTTEFRDTTGDAAQRNHAGWGDKRYVNISGRNDIVASKATYDADNLHFYARTSAPLTSTEGDNWMLLFLNSDNNAQTGWMGFDFVINRGPIVADKTARGQSFTAQSSVSRNIGNRYEWGAGRSIRIAARNNELEIALPRWIVGADKTAPKMAFKWADNCFEHGDWRDFALNGDAAPNDRYTFQLTTAP